MVGGCRVLGLALESVGFRLEGWRVQGLALEREGLRV